MRAAPNLQYKKRYQIVTEEKAGGATYTPPNLADFVATQIIDAADLSTSKLCVLDPAAGDGELLLSLLAKLTERTTASIVVYGFDTDQAALEAARQRLRAAFPKAELHLERGNFLNFALEQTSLDLAPSLFTKPT